MKTGSIRINTKKEIWGKFAGKYLSSFWFSLNVVNTGNLSVFYFSKFKDYLPREFVNDTENLILNFTLETLTVFKYISIAGKFFP